MKRVTAHQIDILLPMPFLIVSYILIVKATSGDVRNVYVASRSSSSR